jgi:alanine racemase
VREPADIRQTRVEIDVSAIVSNVETIVSHANTPAYAVVKADAYGHGVVPVSRALAASPAVSGLAVALVEEGLELRDAGIDAPILVMGASIGDAHEAIVDAGMIPLVSSAADLARFAAIGSARSAPVPVHVKVDTGMSRLGISRHDVVDVLRAATSVAGGIAVEGTCTHLACADVDDPADPDCLTALQLRRFDDVLASLRGAGIATGIAHAANSAGALLFPASRYDRIRPGLAIYGNGPRPDGVALRPVVTFASEIELLRDLEPGDTASYGARWTAETDARIAIVPVGYADGVPRNLTGSGEVLIRGRRCPLAGTVCMDMILVDVTDLGDAVSLGDPVVVLGGQGDERITTAELAERAGISEYEVTCGISKRVPRVYPTDGPTDGPAVE